MAKISVLIPTLRRPDSFRRAALSVFGQVCEHEIELVAIDNAPEHSARAVFAELQAAAPIGFVSAHEPRPGVAHARNTALRVATGDFIAWIDDDQEAAPNWLAALMAQRQAGGAQSVFGPIQAQAQGAHSAFFESLYSRTGPHQSGPVAKVSGMSNTLQPRVMFDEAEPFPTHTNETGGEDDYIFAAWREAGARFDWATDAHVVEHVEQSRQTLTHGLRRAFAYGQGPCETAWAARDYANIARHMVVGAGQAVLFGASSALCFAFRQPRAFALLDRATRGAGKVFWFKPQRFYGATLERQLA